MIGKMLRTLSLAAVPAFAAALSCSSVLSGCFSDANTRVVNYAMPMTPETMTVDLCVTACTMSGFPFVGLTGHAANKQGPAQGYCYCGITLNDAPAVPAAQCNVTCPGGGDPSKPCGGNYLMSLYNTTCDGPLPPAPVGPALANGTACSQPEVQGLPFCNTSLSFAERAADLVSRIALSEAGPQLTARNSPSIPRLGLPAFYWGTNAIHGLTNPVNGGVLCLDATGRCVTIWPSGPSLGATFNASAWQLMGATTGIEARALGNVQWGPTARPGVGMDGLTMWGPTINLIRDPRWGRIQETASEDPYLNGVFSSQITRGMQYGVDERYLLSVATLKHFAVYSLEDYMTPSGQHLTRENIDNEVNPFDMFDSYFPHFKAAMLPVEQGGGGAAGVMMAMNEVNGVPCLANPDLIRQLDAWGGKHWGYVSTDGINMIDSMISPEPDGHGYCPYHNGTCSRDEGVKAAVQAGSDIADGSEYDQSLLSALLAGNITIGDIQQRLFNTFLIRMRLGLLDPVTNQPYLQYGAGDVGSDEHRSYSLQAARESMVLLQNPTAPSVSAPILPFTVGAGTAVIGFAANQTGSLVSNYVNQMCPNESYPKATCYPSLLQSIQALGEPVVYSQGCSDASDCSADQISAAIAAASANGVKRIVLVLGLDQNLEREQKDRENITLPYPQMQLFNSIAAVANTNKVPLAVVLVHGGAVSVPEIKASVNPPVAILDAFYPGPLGGQAIAETIYGLNKFLGGKLPYTIYDAPYQTAVPFNDMNVASQGRTYRYHDDASSPGGPALWHFGYGLSYASFDMQWSPAAPTPITLTPSSSSAKITVAVTNTGATQFDGDEVVQAYFIPVTSTLVPPIPPYVPLRQLFSFQRVHVPYGTGTAVNVDVTINAPSLALTLSDGTQGPIDGTYTIVMSRGQGVGPELTVNCTLQGFSD